MTQILHISSSSNTTSSFSRQIGALTLAELKSAIPDANVVERDLVKNSIPHVSPEFVGSLYSPEVGLPEMALSDELTTELLQSDILVIESPMYNFSIPSVLKAWIDHIARAGRTFKYGAAGPEGLATGKKAILVLASGGVYSSGAYQAYSHQESYLKQILGFIGITDIEVIHIEGVASGPEKAEAAVANAKKNWWKWWVRSLHKARAHKEDQPRHCDMAGLFCEGCVLPTLYEDVLIIIRGASLSRD